MWKTVSRQAEQVEKVIFRLSHCAIWHPSTCNTNLQKIRETGSFRNHLIHLVSWCDTSSTCHQVRCNSIICIERQLNNVFLILFYGIKSTTQRPILHSYESKNRAALMPMRNSGWIRCFYLGYSSTQNMLNEGTDKFNPLALQTQRRLGRRHGIDRWNYQLTVDRQCLMCFIGHR